MECYYCHKKGHVRRNSEELRKHLEAMRNQESKDALDSTNVDEDFESEYDLLFVIANDFSSWILDFGCLFHVCPYKKYFDTCKPCDFGTILIDNDFRSKAIRIGTMQVNMFDGVVRTLSNVRHVPK